MPFGLINASADFQHIINDILRDYRDVFCTAYLDDILIYSYTLEDNKKHVWVILQPLTKAGGFLNAKKCEFLVQETKYLGLIISKDSIKMYPTRVDIVRN